MQSLRPRKPLLLKLAVFLLLGAIINVAVAWGLCLFAPLSGTPHYTNGLGATDASWLAERGWHSLPDNGEFTHPVSSIFDEGVGVDFRWLAESRQIKEDRRIEYRSYTGGAWYFLVSVDAGWPMRCSTGRVIDGRAFTRSQIPGPLWLVSSADTGLPFLSNFETAWAATLPAALPKAKGMAGKFLPLGPVWPGFAINTVFYAGLLWALWFGPGKIRRFVRIRGHRCPACGYKIDSAPGIGPRCSECGHPLHNHEPSS